MTTHEYIFSPIYKRVGPCSFSVSVLTRRPPHAPLFYYVQQRQVKVRGY